MQKTFKTAALATASVFLLNGCFFVGQIRDKLNEDCAVHPDSVRRLPQAEQQALAKKCGWKPQSATASGKPPLVNTERLCRETVTAPPTQGKTAATVSQKIPGNLTLQYNIVDGSVPELKIFYPDGKTETHTRFVGGKAEGWSEGYYPSGKVRTRFFYQNGKAKKYEVYDENGTVAEQQALVCR